MSLYSNCLPLLRQARANQPDASVPVWDLGYRGWPWGAAWREFPKVQESLVKAFLQEAPNCYLQMDPSDVLDWAPAMGWARPYKETFQLPSGLKGASLTNAVLHVGGYHLYCAPAPVEPSHLRVDPWRTPPAELVSSIADLGITASIAAYYDDDSWRIVFPHGTLDH